MIASSFVKTALVLHGQEEAEEAVNERRNGAAISAMKTDGASHLCSSTSSLFCENLTLLHPDDKVTTATAGQLTSLHLFAALFGGLWDSQNHGNTDI
ncbi:hypothetical protein AMECASPLE_027451 [Ameca splendens]|uniref:Uncharacterized protein n=1 Tax=Ameca splendens TaxID=208324 RepID=A0ABV0Y518_9TELE